MPDKKAFCEECRDDVEYTIKKVRKTSTITKGTFEYDGEDAICNRCGAYVYIPEISDANLKALYDVIEKSKS